MHKCLLHVAFRAGCGDEIHGSARMAVELPFCPTKDFAFEHPVWSDGRTPRSVTFNLATGIFLVVMPEEDGESLDNVETQKQLYASHGWVVS